MFLLNWRLTCLLVIDIFDETLKVIALVFAIQKTYFITDL